MSNIDPIRYVINCEYTKFFDVFGYSLTHISAIFCAFLGIRLGFSLLKDSISK